MRGMLWNQGSPEASEVWTAWPCPQGQGRAVAILLAGLEEKKLALPEPRGGNVQRHGEQLGGAQGLEAGAERWS